MKITYDDQTAIVSGEFIDPFVVFDCGQTFRFEREEQGMSGIAMGKRINVQNHSDGLHIFPTTPGEMGNVWSDYFDLATSYTELEREFARDDVLKRTLECCAGMRLLNQQPFEIIISFLVSQNNHIPRIKKIIAGICARFGTHLGGEDYAFPTPEQLSAATEQDLKTLGAGYRAAYIKNTVSMLADMDTDALFSLEYEEARNALLTLSGVGPKVADCILLFAFKKKNAFPKDVWMKRVLEEYYSFIPKNDAALVSFVRDKFGDNAGIAQQYLFHYIRKRSSLKSE